LTTNNPLTGAPMTIYNQDPTTRGAVRNVVATLPELEQHYNGVEFQVNTRLTQATVFGGLTIGSDYGDQDSPPPPVNNDLNHPNPRIFNRGAIGFDATYQIRGGFSYRLPADVQISGSVREATGQPQVRLYPVTTAIVPNLTQVTQNVQVAARGDFRYPWVNLVDLRFAKSFRYGNTRFEPIV